MTAWIALAALTAAAGGSAASPMPPAGTGVVGPVPAPGPGGRMWSLSEILGEADTHQPDVRDAKLRAGEARGDLETAGLIPNPQLQLGVNNFALTSKTDPSTSDFGLLVWGAGVSEDLELGGKRGKRQASAEAAVSASDAQVRDAQRTSHFDIQKAFLQALWAEERQRIASESLARYLDSVRLVKARFEAGEDAGADVNKIELEKQRYTQDARESARAAVEARAELFRLVGIPGNADADRVDGSFPKLAPPADADALVQQALRDRPDLLALQAAQDKAEKDLALARAQAIPDVNLGLAYAYSGSITPSGAASSLGATATVNLPLFNRNQGEIQKAELEVDRAKLANERGRADAEREVRLALGHLASASTAVDDLESDYLGRADKALQIAERSFREGKASLLEFLEAQRTYLETRASYVDALLERGASVLELERAEGSGGAP